MRYILTADDTSDREKLGGKAAALAALQHADLRVPPWFVVSPEAVEGTPPRDLRPHPALLEELAAMVRRLCPGRERVAVRSSAVEEDAATHSFAGQLESYVFVHPEQVLDRVVDVWRSGFTERVLRYREQHGLQGMPPPPAVLVQRMIESSVAGVAFAADPVTGRRDVVVVSAVLGLGTSLVSGDADADTWHVDRTGEITQRDIAEKHTADRRDEAGGIRQVPVAESDGRRPALGDDQIRAVAGLARRVSDHFGEPQDIEWAMEAGRLYLIQSRPITTLASVADPDGITQLWDNSNIVESYSGITTPLTFSFARRAYEEVYRQFVRIMGVPAETIEQNAEVFRCMLGLIRGRVYYNLLNWYRLLAMLPGFRTNRKFMEQMMGVREGLPASLTAELAEGGAGSRWRDRLRLVRSLGGLVGNGMTLGRRSQRFYERLDTALAEPTPPLAEQRADELAAAYRTLESRLLSRWDAPIVNDFFAMVFHGLLRKLTGSWCRDSGGHLHNDLLCGEGGMISTEPARRMREMAEIVAQDPALLTQMTDRPVAEILNTLRGQETLQRQYESYLDAFGDRCLEELKLESATLHDEPLPLLRGVGHLARRLAARTPGAEDENVEQKMRRDAEERIREALDGQPIRRLLFRWVLRHARHRVRDRENLRFERTRVFGRVRRLFVELGRRLHAAGCLTHPRDVFYLEVEEVLGFVNGTTSTVDLAGLAALRKAEFATFADQDAPDERFETRGMVHQGNAFRSTETLVESEDGDTRTGLGCCPGVVRGTVQVVLDPRGVSLRGGSILVAPRTDPGWIMIFPSASALLVERGSLLSHSAIVAREMGIPAIVAIPGLTSWLEDGDTVEMDGATGVVRRIDAPPPGAATEPAPEPAVEPKVNIECAAGNGSNDD